MKINKSGWKTAEMAEKAISVHNHHFPNFQARLQGFEKRAFTQRVQMLLVQMLHECVEVVGIATESLILDISKIAKIPVYLVK